MADGWWQKLLKWSLNIFMEVWAQKHQTKTSTIRNHIIQLKDVLAKHLLAWILVVLHSCFIILSINFYKWSFSNHSFYLSHVIFAWIFTQFHVLIMDIQISTYDHLHLNFITLSWIFIFPIPIFSKRFYSFWIVTKLICVIFTVCELKRND